MGTSQIYSWISTDLKKVLQTINFLVFAPALVALFALELAAWDLAKDEEGIQISTRFTSESKLKEFRAEMEVNAPLEKFIAIMEDVSTYPTWMHNCKEARVLKRISKDERITYLMNETSWITKRRDMIVYSKVTRRSSPKEIMIQLDGRPDYIPPHEDHIRVPRIKGYWKFISQKNGKTRATYQLILEPGGSIPDWLANSTVVEIPFNTMINLRQLAEKK